MIKDFFSTQSCPKAVYYGQDTKARFFHNNYHIKFSKHQDLRCPNSVVGLQALQLCRCKKMHMICCFVIIFCVLISLFVYYNFLMAHACVLMQTQILNNNSTGLLADIDCAFSRRGNLCMQHFHNDWKNTCQGRMMHNTKLTANRIPRRIWYTR